MIDEKTLHLLYREARVLVKVLSCFYQREESGSYKHPVDSIHRMFDVSIFVKRIIEIAGSWDVGERNSWEPFGPPVRLREFSGVNYLRLTLNIVLQQTKNVAAELSDGVKYNYDGKLPFAGGLMALYKIEDMFDGYWEGSDDSLPAAFERYAKPFVHKVSEPNWEALETWAAAFQQSGDCDYLYAALEGEYLAILEKFQMRNYEESDDDEIIRHRREIAARISLTDTAVILDGIPYLVSPNSLDLIREMVRASPTPVKQSDHGARLDRETIDRKLKRILHKNNAGWFIKFT